jgi:hypothetical protein
VELVLLPAREPFYLYAANPPMISEFASWLCSLNVRFAV